ncbi:hypothetical protein ACU4GR_29185 [Methylobacterium oryzae CBMB20]
MFGEQGGRVEPLALWRDLPAEGCQDIADALGRGDGRSRRGETLYFRQEYAIIARLNTLCSDWENL